MSRKSILTKAKIRSPMFSSTSSRTDSEVGNYVTISKAIEAIMRTRRDNPEVVVMRVDSSSSSRSWQSPPIS